ncbi:hypothetical protein [Parashewanella tropica]|uniref:hypothetical protein n=1 Tax=Parashewanella tropica TaxID=2547970 RepID=UPI00105AA5C8|nr:hypothetical protein [Parashewanella tropica]
MNDFSYREIDLIPDGWVIVKISADRIFYKILSNWNEFDEWRLSSGATTDTLRKIPAGYVWQQASGNTYMLLSENEGKLSQYNQLRLEGFLEYDEIETLKIEDVRV